MDLSALRHEERGDGTPLLLINGQFQSRDSWDPSVAQLSRLCRTLTFEYPNQGQSPVAADMNTMMHYGEFTLAYLNHIGVDPGNCIVHGYSFGGNVARYMHLEMGVDFRAMVLFGVGPHRLAEFQLRRLAVWEELLEKGELDLFVRVVMLQSFSAEFIAAHPRHFDVIMKAFIGQFRGRLEAARALVYALADHFRLTRPEADRYRCSVHLVGAVADLLTPWTYVENYANEVGASLHCLPGGHQSRVEHHGPYLDLMTKLMMQYV